MKLRTKNNHFRYQDVHGRFCPKYGKIQRRVGDFRFEAIRAAREIGQCFARKTIFLGLSGGIDSEVMACAFLQAKVPFEAIILKMENDKNAHDWKWAVRWCRKHKVKFRFFEFNVQTFVRSQGYKEVARLGDSHLFTLLPTMKMMEWVSGLGGVAILGSGECYVELSTDKWNFIERRRYAGLHRYADAIGAEAVPSFFQWSPELMASAIIDPLFANFVLNPMPKVIDSEKFKREFYDQHFDLLGLRTKFTGYEKLKKTIVAPQAELLKKYKKDLAEVHVPYGQMLLKLGISPKLWFR